MSATMFKISYDTNGAKVVEHPSNGDVWNETNACIDILQSGAPVSAVAIIISEIRWFDKYRGTGISVSDPYLHVYLDIDEYIADLEANIFIHDNIFGSDYDTSYLDN